MDNNKYPKLREWTSAWIIVYAVIFFVFINCIVYFVFKDTSSRNFEIDTDSSYVAIKAKFDIVKKDKNKKVIFIGGSALRGGRVASTEETAPFLFSKYVKKGTSIYNFSFPSAKPLDQFLFFWLLRDSADLFIVDVNTLFLKEVYANGVAGDSTKYNRISELLQSNADAFLADVPEVKKCLNENGIFPIQGRSFDLYERLPVVRYKDDINFALFGKHFSLFFDSLISAFLDLAKTGGRQTDWKNILKPTPPLADHGPFMELTKEKLEKLDVSLNSCVLSSFSYYTRQNDMPVVFYVSPHSRYATSVQRKDPIYEENLLFTESLFSSSTYFFDLDKKDVNPVPNEDFADEVHFNKAGHKMFAEYLVNLVKNIPRFSPLFY